MYLNFNTPAQKLLEQITPDKLQQYEFAEGSMKPKVKAACDFVNQPGKRAVIGSLEDIEQIIQGNAGTLISL